MDFIAICHHCSVAFDIGLMSAVLEKLLSVQELKLLNRAVGTAPYLRSDFPLQDKAPAHVNMDNDDCQQFPLPSRNLPRNPGFEMEFIEMFGHV